MGGRTHARTHTRSASISVSPLSCVRACVRACGPPGAPLPLFHPARSAAQPGPGSDLRARPREALRPGGGGCSGERVPPRPSLVRRAPLASGLREADCAVWLRRARMIANDARQRTRAGAAAFLGAVFNGDRMRCIDKARSR